MKILHIVIALLLLSVPGIAGDVSLAWDPSPSQGIVGYKVYFGNASGIYDGFKTTPNQTTYTVTDLAAGTYYFAVSALDAAGNESGYSNEVSAAVPGIPGSCHKSDLNCDGAINVLDLQVLINCISGAGECPTGE